MIKNIDTKNQLKGFFFHEPFEDGHWPEILDELYIKKVYQRFLPNNKENTICVSLGANVGLVTYYMAKYFSKVYAVEPASQHLEALTANVKQNNLSNVIVVPLALSNKNGTTRFYHNDNQTMFSMESMVNKKDDYEEVKTIAMDSLFEKYKIDHVDLMKLDCEGSESLIIASEGFKKVAPKIKVIAGEYHDWTSMSKPNFQRCLEDQGYQFKWRHDTAASVFECERV